MSDVVDVTLLSGQMQEIAREVRLLRLQLDNLAAALPPRLAVIEQSFHDLVGEVSRGFGQMQQQLTRQEKRFDALDAGLAQLRTDLDASTARILVAITGAAR
jgi:hypothetical protein